MKNENIIKVPLFGTVWKKVAYLFFPLPILLIAVLVTADLVSKGEIKIQGELVADLCYASWAIGLIILINTKEKEEDEMINTIRLQSFQTGFYWLMWGLGAIILIHLIGNFGVQLISGPPITAALVMFLLSAYIYLAFRYQLWKVSKP
ncbi:hypothetical protein [Cecembia rubra]|uniref:hypothetical protein n=1 Tax=Cecembia rubra TaxID=1485585 RepID=UPI00271504FB|nr:hypothetical protein [Cecembia rubra]